MPQLCSILFVPGHSAKMQAKALQSTADLVMFDLEDSVPLAERDRSSANYFYPEEPTRTPSPFGITLQRIEDRLVLSRYD